MNWRSPLSTNRYLERGDLRVELLGRGFAWFDTGTHDSLVEAAGFVQTIEKRQNQRIAVPEEIAFLNGWISIEELVALGHRLRKNGYGEYLLRLADELDPRASAGRVTDPGDTGNSPRLLTRISHQVACCHRMVVCCQ